jgi:hypothetical protein
VSVVLQGDLLEFLSDLTQELDATVDRKHCNRFIAVVQVMDATENYGTLENNGFGFEFHLHESQVKK